MPAFSQVLPSSKSRSVGSPAIFKHRTTKQTRYHGYYGPANHTYELSNISEESFESHAGTKNANHRRDIRTIVTFFQVQNVNSKVIETFYFC